MQWREMSEMIWKKQLCRHQGQWRRRGEEVPETSEQRSFPCSSWWRPWWGRLSPCSPRRFMVQQRSTCSPWKGPHAGAGSCQDLRTHGERSPRHSRFTGRTCDPVGDPRWGSLFLKDCTLWEGPTLGQFVKNCTLWEGLMLEKLGENCLLWEEPSFWSRGRVWRILPLRRKERQR